MMVLVRLQTMDEEGGHSDHDIRRRHRVRSEDVTLSPAVTAAVAVATVTSKRVRTGASAVMTELSSLQQHIAIRQIIQRISV